MVDRANTGNPFGEHDRCCPVCRTDLRWVEREVVALVGTERQAGAVQKLESSRDGLGARIGSLERDVNHLKEKRAHSEGGKAEREKIEAKDPRARGFGYAGTLLGVVVSLVEILRYVLTRGG